MNCDFRAYKVCTNFHRGLLQRGRRTGVEPLSLIIQIMQRHLSDILRCEAILYSCTTDAVFSEVHDHWANRERQPTCAS